MEDRIKKLDKDISSQALAISDEILTSSLTIPGGNTKERKDLDSMWYEISSFKSHVLEWVKEVNISLAKKVDIDQLKNFETLEANKFCEFNAELLKIKSDIFKALWVLDQRIVDHLEAVEEEKSDKAMLTKRAFQGTKCANCDWDL
jgi:hypothetical protein